MLTLLRIRNFKLFEEVEIELGQRVLLVGPNNRGKSTALQALALWEAGLRKWLELRAGAPAPEKRPGVTINRRDLVAIPVPSARLLWRDLHVRSLRRDNDKPSTQNILIEILVRGISGQREWECGFEFDYANEESFYCRPLRTPDGRMPVPEAAGGIRLAYLPPMSGLAAHEDRLDPGAIRVRLGEGRTAEVLRNLCYGVLTGVGGAQRWRALTERMKELFGVEMEEPRYVEARGQIELTYRDPSGARLDLSASGRGQQQTLLLLAYLAWNPGNVLLLDEPDAHLEILRQRQIYDVLSRSAEETGSQILAASHSEVLLNEAAGRDVVIAFVGRPHRIDARAISQILKALRDVGFEHYYLAEQKGWVLYLEGSSDLAILQAVAEKLQHPARLDMQRAFVHYCGNQPSRAREHFHALREAHPGLRGIAVYDRLDRELAGDPHLTQVQWRRREIENYICRKEVLLRFAQAEWESEDLPLLSGLKPRARELMEAAISEVEEALQKLGKPDPWGADLKVSDEFLAPVFRAYYQKMELPNRMNKSDYWELARFLEPEEIDGEVVKALDQIHEVASSARGLD